MVTVLMEGSVNSHMVLKNCVKMIKLIPNIRQSNVAVLKRECFVCMEIGAISFMIKQQSGKLER